MEGTSPSSFPTNYVTLKDLQERWIKRKQDEENEQKLRRIREEEEHIKPHNKNKAKNHHPNSKTPTRSAKNPPSSPPSHSQGQQNRAHRKNTNPANCFNTNEWKAKKSIDPKSKTSPAISGRMKPKIRRSAADIAGKREEKEGKGFESVRGDRTAEILRPAADLSLAGGYDRRKGGYRGRRGGGAARVSPSSAGMVWVRKTTEG